MAFTPSNELIRMLKDYEAFSSTTYLDVAGLQTIGYGHLILEGEIFNEPITMDFAHKLLISDITRKAAPILNRISVPLTQKQVDALVSFAYNVGVPASDSQIIQAVNRKDHLHVPREMLSWINAGGKPRKGLVTRRLKEAVLYIEGINGNG